MSTRPAALLAVFAIFLPSHETTRPKIFKNLATAEEVV